MATIKQRGASWQLQFTDATGKRQRRSLGRVSEKEARVALRELELALETGGALAASIPSLSYYAVQSYLPWHDWKYPHSSWRSASIVRLHLEPVMGMYPLDKIDVPLAERYAMQRMQAGAKKETIKKELRTLAAIMNRAIVEGILVRNPMKGADVPGANESKPPHWYTREELARLYESENDPVYRWCWQFLAYTGLRRAEFLFNLTRATIDRQAGYIDVLSSEQRRTKSGKWRRIPLCRPAEEALGHLIDSVPGPGVAPRVYPQSFSRACVRSLQRAGLTGSAHCLRHTFVSMLVEQGVDLRTVQELAGHASYETTLRYAHVRDEHKRAAVAALDL